MGQSEGANGRCGSLTTKAIDFGITPLTKQPQRWRFSVLYGMNDARLRISIGNVNRAGMPITHYSYGSLLSNGTVFLLLGALEGSVEITCTREWALEFAKSLKAALGEQNGEEFQIPAPSAPFPAGQSSSAGI